MDAVGNHSCVNSTTGGAAGRSIITDTRGKPREGSWEPVSLIGGSPMPPCVWRFCGESSGVSGAPCGIDMLSDGWLGGGGLLRPRLIL